MTGMSKIFAVGSPLNLNLAFWKYSRTLDLYLRNAFRTLRGKLNLKVVT